MTPSAAVLVDQVAVDEVVAGRLKASSVRRAERDAAILVLTDRGWSALRIAQLLGTNDRAVARARSRARQTAGS